MDREFHYYITYLIAARAGFDHGDAGIIAKSCQAADENTRIYNVYEDDRLTYFNYVSQTADLLRPRYSRMRIYPVFHFIPGDTGHPGARRKDGRTHPLNTTPDSPLANKCMDDALETGNLYEIGIACHAFADTWAHQNFVGYKHDFNDFGGFLGSLIPSIGHADARHEPDWPAHIWEDPRLISKNRRINNKKRFLAAAARLFEKLAEFKNHSHAEKNKEDLCRDLGLAIGRAEMDSMNRGKSGRQERYRLMAEYREYGGAPIPDFYLSSWRSECLRHAPQQNKYYWRDRRNFTESSWYLFQEAVKKYQKRVLDLYKNTAYAELPEDLTNKVLEFS